MVTVERQREVWHPSSIKGEQVALRHHQYDDLGAVRRWYRDPELARLTRYSLRPMSDEDIDRFFHTRLMSPEHVGYAITVREGGQLIGSTTFSNLDADNSSTLFHISIGERAAWGSGYGTEATELMLWLAFARIGLHRVALSVFDFNTRAIRAQGRLADAQHQPHVLVGDGAQGLCSGNTPGREQAYDKGCGGDEFTH